MSAMDCRRMLLAMTKVSVCVLALAADAGAQTTGADNSRAATHSGAGAVAQLATIPLHLHCRAHALCRRYVGRRRSSAVPRGLATSPTGSQDAPRQTPFRHDTCSILGHPSRLDGCHRVSGANRTIVGNDPRWAVIPEAPPAGRRRTRGGCWFRDAPARWDSSPYETASGPLLRLACGRAVRGAGGRLVPGPAQPKRVGCSLRSRAKRSRRFDTCCCCNRSTAAT